MSAPTGGPTSVIGSDLLVRVAALPPTQGRAAVHDAVRAMVAAALGHPDPADVDPARAFTELGFDSLTVVDLRNRLTTATGLRLRATLAFDHPTVTALADHLADQLVRPGASPHEALAEALEEILRRAGQDVGERHRALAVLRGALDRLGGAAGAATATLDLADDAELFALLDES